MSTRSYYAELPSSQILAKLIILYDAIFLYWVIFNPLPSWILPHTKVRETTVNICCFCCPALSVNHIPIFFTVHLLLLELNLSPNIVWLPPGNSEYCICLATVMVKEWTYKLSLWDGGRCHLISRKYISAPFCEAWDYVRTGDPAIILLPLGTKNVKVSQEMTKDKMSSSDIVWNLKPDLPLDFSSYGSQ